MHLVPHILVFLALGWIVGRALWELGFLSNLAGRERITGIVAFIITSALAPQILRACAAILDRAGDWLTHLPYDLSAWPASFPVAVWSVVMFVACVVGALRLVTFRRGPSRHRVIYAWLSWFYVVALTAVAIKVALGVRPPPGPVETLSCVVIAGLFLAHRGNLAHLHRAARRAVNALVFGSAR